jgi:hypothetical protein
MKSLILTASEKPNPLEPGVYEGLSFEEYQAIPAFSKSMVPYALKSGEHLHHYIHGGGSQTDATKLGSMVDALLLQPGTFEDTFAIRPDTYDKEVTRGRAPNKKTIIEAKPWNANSHTCQAIIRQLEASGKTVVTQATVNKAKEIAEAVMMVPEAAETIANGKTQVAIVWDDADTGVRCKGLIDVLGALHITDLKTTHDASPHEFGRTIGNFLYHVQGAAYRDGFAAATGKELGFRFIVVETSGKTQLPVVALYELDTASLMAGLMMFRRALERVKDWLEFGIRGYSPYWEEVQAPNWIVEREFMMSEKEVNFV